MENIPFAIQLDGGDRRAVGMAAEVAAYLLNHPARIEELLHCAIASSPILRSRATHALMQIAKTSPQLLEPWIPYLLENVAGLAQWEVRSHICQCLSALPLDKAQIDQYLGHLENYLTDKSSIVRTCAMQALVGLCDLDETLLAWVRPLIADLTQSGTAAMRARGRHLLKQLDRRFPSD